MIRGVREPDRTLRVVQTISVFVLAVTVIRWAWIGDDALITVRTAANVAHGWGWGFNATENVQAYTHPLWFLLVLCVGALSGSWIPGLFVLSISIAILAFAILIFSTLRIDECLRIFFALWLSNAVIEYSTSGLENPLSFLGVAVLLVITFRQVTSVRSGNPIFLGLTAAAVVLTRADLVVLVAPVAVWWLLSNRRNLAGIVQAVAAGTVPLVVWVVFAREVYGSVFPNTFVAKTNVAIPQTELFAQGFRYFYFSFTYDPVSLVVIASAIVVAIWWRSTWALVWMTGVILYLAYWSSVGGDFMAGRSFAVTVVVSGAVLSRFPLVGGKGAPLSSRSATAGVVALSVLSMVVVGNRSNALASDLPTSQRWDAIQTARVGDELGAYSTHRRMLSHFLSRSLDTSWFRDGFDPRSVSQPESPEEVWRLVDAAGKSQIDLPTLSRLLEQWPQGDDEPIALLDVLPGCGLLGTIGVVSGPRVHVVDGCALTDAFLAQFESPYNPEWLAGHAGREVPAGYLDAIRSGDPTKLENPNLVPLLWETWNTIGHDRRRAGSD